MSVLQKCVKHPNKHLSLDRKKDFSRWFLGVKGIKPY